MVGGATNICRQVVRRLLTWSLPTHLPTYLGAYLGEWKGWVGSLNYEPSLVLGLDWTKDPFHRFVLLHLLLTRQQRQRYLHKFCILQHSFAHLHTGHKSPISSSPGTTLSYSTQPPRTFGNPSSVSRRLRRKFRALGCRRVIHAASFTHSPSHVDSCETCAFVGNCYGCEPATIHLYHYPSVLLHLCHQSYISFRRQSHHASHQWNKNGLVRLLLAH
jgi:hypothetical protein